MKTDQVRCIKWQSLAADKSKSINADIIALVGAWTAR